MGVRCDQHQGQEEASSQQYFCHKSVLFTSMYALRFVQLNPAGDHTAIVHMHIQTKSDSETLGIPLNANKGFFHTKGRKEKRRGKKEKRWGKLTFPRDLNRSKAFYSPRPLSLGRLLYRRLKSPTLEASSSVSWRLGDVQLGPQKLEHAAFLNGRPCKATGGAGICRPRVPAWASVHRPSETCFPFACSKVCIHSHEAPTIRQQHDTINQNQTSKRVFVGTS